MKNPVTYEGRRIEIRESEGWFQADIWDHRNYEQGHYIMSTFFHANPVAARKRAKAIIDAEDRRRKISV